MESTSEKAQKRILGKRLLRRITKYQNKLPKNRASGHSPLDATCVSEMGEPLRILTQPQVKAQTELLANFAGKSLRKPEGPFGVDPALKILGLL